VQRARGQMQAFPFACYPTFKWRADLEIPDLRFLAIMDDGREVAVFGSRACAFHLTAQAFLLIPFISLWGCYVALVDVRPLTRLARPPRAPRACGGRRRALAPQARTGGRRAQPLREGSRVKRDRRTRHADFFAERPHSTSSRSASADVGLGECSQRTRAASDVNTGTISNSTRSADSTQLPTNAREPVGLRK